MVHRNAPVSIYSVSIAQPEWNWVEAIAASCRGLRGRDLRLPCPIMRTCGGDGHFEGALLVGDSVDEG
jgi:hypothetical protein